MYVLEELKITPGMEEFVLGTLIWDSFGLSILKTFPRPGHNVPNA